MAECRTFNNFMSKVFGLLFRSDRRGCIERIREVGYEAYLSEMKLAGRMNRPVSKKIAIGKRCFPQPTAVSGSPGLCRGAGQGAR